MSFNSSFKGVLIWASAAIGYLLIAGFLLEHFVQPVDLPQWLRIAIVALVGLPFVMMVHQAYLASIKDKMANESETDI